MQKEGCSTPSPREMWTPRTSTILYKNRWNTMEWLFCGEGRVLEAGAGIKVNESVDEMKRSAHDKATDWELRLTQPFHAAVQGRAGRNQPCCMQPPGALTAFRLFQAQLSFDHPGISCRAVNVQDQRDSPLRKCFVISPPGSGSETWVYIRTPTGVCWNTDPWLLPLWVLTRVV